MRVLQPHFPQIAEAWRQRMHAEFAFDDHVLQTLERLSISGGYEFFCEGNFEAFVENLRYYGTRLAKFRVDTRAVARSLEFDVDLCELYLAPLGPERRAEAQAALEMLSSQTFVEISGAYFDTQKKELAALLAVIDAELRAENLEALLERTLHITAETFGATTGLVLLREPEGDVLRAKAGVGFDDRLDEEIQVNLGVGFTGTIAQTGEPAMLADVDCCKDVVHPILCAKARALWGVPLKHGDKVIGVLLIGFERSYEWFPTERELLRAIADRSAIAIDRARMTDSLREREMRIAELSAHLLQVQEQERKHISRELHDETGQALMVIRLYLGMLETSLDGRASRARVRETLAVVDRTIEGLRRIIGRLAPLVLQELGLVAAIRKEAKDLAKSTGVKTRVAISADVGRLAGDIEAAIYRVVQEALHNVAKHAQARSVNVHMSRDGDDVHLLIEDDGVGFASRRPLNQQRPAFGLAGMRERISMLGGTVKIVSAKSNGTRLEIRVPAERSGLETMFPGASLELTPLGRSAGAGDTPN
ncbi:MAG: GAF domain-containing sensor histidine kinase [Terriglobales bacterium]